MSEHARSFSKRGEDFFLSLFSLSWRVLSLTLPRPIRWMTFLGVLFLGPVFGVCECGWVGGWVGVCDFLYLLFFGGLAFGSVRVSTVLRSAVGTWLFGITKMHERRYCCRHWLGADKGTGSTRTVAAQCLFRLF